MVSLDPDPIGNLILICLHFLSRESPSDCRPRVQEALLLDPSLPRRVDHLQIAAACAEVASDADGAEVLFANSERLALDDVLEHVDEPVPSTKQAGNELSLFIGSVERVRASGYGAASGYDEVNTESWFRRYCEGEVLLVFCGCSMLEIHVVHIAGMV